MYIFEWIKFVHIIKILKYCFHVRLCEIWALSPMLTVSSCDFSSLMNVMRKLVQNNVPKTPRWDRSSWVYLRMGLALQNSTSPKKQQNNSHVSLSKHNANNTGCCSRAVLWCADSVLHTLLYLQNHSNYIKWDFWKLPPELKNYY